MGRNSNRRRAFSKQQHTIKEVRRRGVLFDQDFQLKYKLEGRSAQGIDRPVRAELEAKIADPIEDVMLEEATSTFDNSHRRMSPGHQERFS